MRKSKKTLVLLLMCFACTAMTQTDTLVNGGTNKSKLEYKIAYFGNNLWYPGLTVGAEYVLKEQVKERIVSTRKGDVTKTKTRRLLFNAELGFYWHPGSYVGVFNSYGVIYRKTFNKKFQYNLGVNPLSYYRSFLPETYEVDDDGNVEKVILPGRSYYAPSVLFGIGKNREGKAIKAWFLNFNVTTLIPYGLGAMPLISLQYGVRFGKRNEKSMKEEK